MSVRPSESTGLSTKQKLCLFHGTSVSAETVLGMDEEDITYDLIVSSGIKANNLAAAGIGPKRLKAMGVGDASKLRSLGFDALYLADPRFASETNAAFGSEETKRVYLQSASDAVAIAGTDAMVLLGITTNDLIEACAGATTEAHAVLQQLSVGIALEGVPASVVLDTGLRKNTLMELGYSLTAIVQQTKASGSELAKLGFLLS
jgi:hypothetical protein